MDIPGRQAGRRMGDEVMVMALSEVLVGGVPCCSPVTGVPLTADQAARLAGILKVIAEPSRLRLVSTLVSMPGAAACGCELTGPLGLSQPTVSHHLAILLKAGLIERLPGGRCTYYRLVPETLIAIAGVLIPRSETAVSVVPV